MLIVRGSTHLIGLFMAAGLYFLLPAGTSADTGAPSYDAQVRPLLARHCYKCHGPEERKGGLRLSTEADARSGGDSGSPLVQTADGSFLLLQRISSADDAERMPPKSPPLPAEDIAVLAAWLEAGAPFGAEDTGEHSGFWSFQAPVQPAPPALEAGWGRNPIDAFALQAMRAQGLSPSPEADRNRLIRRLSLDLRGLPPTPEEVRAFVADTRPDAYERLVETYLASPQYGERMAVSWLDVARYADTNGYEKDRPRSIWPYRDWVIRAFNNDMPFDRFVIEQMAGDLLPSPTLDQRIATGFFRNEMLNEEGGIDVEEFRYKNVVDRTNTVGTALLGLTLGCAQCHSHKYDPISQQEYFELFAFLNNTDDSTLAVPDAETTRKRAEQKAQIDALKEGLRARFPTHDPNPTLTTLVPEAVAAETGTLQLAGDRGVVEVANAGADANVYTVNLTLGPGRLDGLALDVFSNGTGPGRAPHGNFVLSEFTVTRDDGAGLPFGRAEADFSQENYGVALAIDGQAQSGWAVGGDPAGMNRDRRASFYFKDPLVLDRPERVTVRVEQRHGQGHTLGNFRLSTIQMPVTDTTKSEDERRARFFAQQFNTWADETRVKARAWQDLTPIEMSAEKHTTLTRLSDNSILAEGDIPNNDVYHLAMRSDAPEVTGIRLEVLPHESLPGGGPGRGVILAEGDFLLTEVKVSAAPWTDPDARVEVPVASATESYADGGKTAALALDGKSDTGWSIKGGEGTAHGAVFAFASPVSFPGGTLFYITLEQKYIHQHTLGRFRLAVTSGGETPEAAGVPADVESLLLSDARTAEEQAALEQYYLEHSPLLADARAEISALEKGMPRYATTLVLEEREQVRTAHVHHRGEFLQPKEAVAPAVPAVLPTLPDAAPRNRLTLARWLVSDENPLTARVTMNRLWQQFFGRGIVATTEDFGMMGEAPTHPALLDWMAVEFVRRGWRTKDMVRLIVSSVTYRQSARVTPEHLAVDPKNVYLARAPRFRVDAELVRDIALAAAGSLDTTVGGPSVFPPLPEGLMEFVYGGFKWQTDSGAARQRRGMYTYWKRMLPYPTASVFDAPTRDIVCVRRLRTNTPMQALTLLNDEVFMDAARALANDLIRSTPGDPAQRLQALFMRCLSRQPDAEEEKAMLSYLEEQRELLATLPPEELQALTLDPAGPEEAAWTLLCRVVLNLDETITRG